MIEFFVSVTVSHWTRSTRISSAASRQTSETSRFASRHLRAISLKRCSMSSMSILPASGSTEECSEKKSCSTSRRRNAGVFTRNSTYSHPHRGNRHCYTLNVIVLHGQGKLLIHEGVCSHQMTVQEQLMDPETIGDSHENVLGNTHALGWLNKCNSRRCRCGVCEFPLQR